MKILFVYIFYFLLSTRLWASPIDTLLKPSRGATQVPANTRLQIYFNEPIQKGSGNVSVYDGSSNNLIFSIPITCACIEIQNNRAMITLPSVLSANQVVFVKILSGVFKSLSNEPFAGFPSSTEWRFTIASGLISNQGFNPANSNECVSIKQNSFQLTLSGNVNVNYNANGKIYIYEASSNIIHEKISVGSSQVIANNTNTVTFLLNKPLRPATPYYILIDPMSFIGSGGSIYEGIYDRYVWSFQTSEDKAFAESVETCGAGNVTLKASYSKPFVKYRWYKNITDEVPILSETGQPIDSSILVTFVDKSTTYYVSVFNYGCFSYERTPINITIKPKPNSTLPLPQMRVDKGTYVQLEANGGDTYSWLPTDGLSNPNIANPVVYVEKDSLCYTVTITNSVGCSTQRTVCLIPSDGEKDLFIPTVFSPNDDGVHDLLRIRGKNIAEIDWSIYDSQGKLIYRTQNITDALNKGWDGTFQGKPLKSDIYIWTLVGKFSDGSALPNKAGSVLLIR